MRERDQSSAEFFEAKYRAAADGDPWKFATRDYELRRYDAVMRALGGRRYARGFEPGCSVGVLTERLATVCDEVDACDFHRPLRPPQLHGVPACLESKCGARRSPRRNAGLTLILLYFARLV